LALGILLALGSALAWGGSDFFGGIASRRRSHVEVLAVSRVSLIVVLLVCVALTGEQLPTLRSAVWAAGAGISGALGIASLYRGLATQRSSLVMPTAGVVGAAVPVLFAGIFEGVLPILQQAGLAVALVGIWLVSKGHDTDTAGASRGLGIGALAGIGFGGFFIMLGQVGAEAAFFPFLVAGVSGSAAAALVLIFTGTSLPVPWKLPRALIAGMMDAAGLVCYGLAIRSIRLDIAAVLGSLFPAVAVLLFWGLAKERVSKQQWFGIAVCVAAIGLIVS